MSDIFLTCLIRVWEPLCNSCCDWEPKLPIHAIDPNDIFTPEARKRFAIASHTLHSVQHLRIASLPRGGVADLHQLDMGACHVLAKRAQDQAQA